MLDLLEAEQYDEVSVFIKQLRDEDVATTGGLSAASSLVSVMISQERSESTIAKLQPDPPARDGDILECGYFRIGFRFCCEHVG